MGFLDKIFGTPKAKDYQLADAMVLIENELHSLQSSNREEQYNVAQQIHSKISSLRGSIEDFSKKGVPELAKSSANVKERFCAISIKQLGNLHPPSSNEPWAYLQNVKDIVNSLGGLTQRQIIHINFFFKEDFTPVAKKIHEINALLNPKQKGSDHVKAVSMYKQIKELDKHDKELNASRLLDEEKLKQLEEERNILPPLIEHQDAGDLEKTRGTLKKIRQEVDSLLAVQKLLKKYAYAAKINDELVEEYIESPSRAIVKDENLKVMEYITNAAQLISEGKLEEDTSGKKIEAVLGSQNYLREKRDELVKTIALVKEEERADQSQKAAFAEKLREHNNTLAHLESQIKDVTKLIEKTKEEESGASKELTRMRVELCALTSKILNANVS